MTTTPPSRRTGWFRSAWQDLRQRRYPVEFRIPRAAWPVDVRADLERVAALLAAPAPTTAAAAPGDAARDDDALVKAAIGLWRTQRRVDAQDEGDDSRLSRHVRLHLRTAWAGLAELGLTVRTHDGEPFDSGLALVAEAFQPHPGATREIVIETVSPTVLLAGRMIRPGKVVVGRPEGMDPA